MDNSFTQLCVWEGVTLGDETPEMFEASMSELFNGARFKFAEEVVTNGSEVRNEEGGRHDLLFYVHDDDISSFAVPRLAYRIPGGRTWYAITRVLIATVLKS